MTAAVAPGPWLAPDIHAVVIEDDVLFLDLRRDAYVCLAGVAGDLRLDVAARRLDVADPGLREDLTIGGVLAPHPQAPGVQGRPWPGRPSASVFPRTSALPPLADLAPMLASLADLSRAYRGRPLPDLLRGVARTSEAAPALSPRLLAEVARFHRWSPYAPVTGKCLLRSFMLLRGLRRAGLDALWVFGVTTWPFRAHCWLQVGQTVLDDTAERVGDYTPIMVV